jgi:nucleoside-diphosphate-sugar epimerase
MPLSPYAVSKLAAENYLTVFAQLYGMETLSLRYFNVFGPGQTPDGAYAAAIPRFVDCALRGETVQIFGDGEQTRDFCFVKNTVGANLLAADSSKKLQGQVVNVAGARRVGLNDLVREIGEMAPPPDTEISDDPRLALFHLAALSPLGAVDRQRILAAPGSAERLVALQEALDDAAAVLEFRRA